MSTPERLGGGLESRSLRPLAATAAALLLAAVSFMIFNRSAPLAGLDRDDACALMGGLPLIEPGIAPAICQRTPLTYLPYRGPWEIYSMLPFAAAMPDDLAKAIRICTNLWALAFVLASYALGLVLHRDWRVALLYGVYVGGTPFLVENLDHGFLHSGVAAATACAIGLASLIRFLEMGSTRAWFLSCIATGFAVALAPQAAAFAAAWIICLVLFRHRLWDACRLPTIALSVLLLSIGSFPLILENLRNDWEIFDFLAEALKQTSQSVDNRRYWENFVLRLEHLVSVFGRPWWAWTKGQASAQAGLFVAAGLGALLVSFRDRQRGLPLSPRLLAPSLVLLVTIVLSPLTLSGLGRNHLVFLLPLVPALLLQVPGIAFGGVIRKPVLDRLMRGVIVIMIIVGGLGLRRYWERSESRGRSTMNPLIGEVAEWISRQPQGPVVLLGPWLAAPSFHLLTDFRPVQAVFERPNAVYPSYERMLEQAVAAETSALYVDHHASDFPSGPGLRVLDQLARKLGRRLDKVKEFHAGRDRFEVYAVLPLSRPE